MKNIRVFYLKIFVFFEVKFSIYLNRRVFIMVKFSIYLNRLVFEMRSTFDDVLFCIVISCK